MWVKVSVPGLGVVLVNLFSFPITLPAQPLAPGAGRPPGRVRRLTVPPEERGVCVHSEQRWGLRDLTAGGPSGWPWRRHGSLALGLWPLAGSFRHSSASQCPASPVSSARFSVKVHSGKAQVLTQQKSLACSTLSPSVSSVTLKLKALRKTGKHAGPLHIRPTAGATPPVLNHKRDPGGPEALAPLPW